MTSSGKPGTDDLLSHRRQFKMQQSRSTVSSRSTATMAAALNSHDSKHYNLLTRSRRRESLNQQFNDEIE